MHKKKRLENVNHFYNLYMVDRSRLKIIMSNRICPYRNKQVLLLKYHAFCILKSVYFFRLD